MLAFDLDTNDTKALNFAFSEPITAVDKHGKDASEAGNNAFKVIQIIFIILYFLYLMIEN